MELKEAKKILNKDLKRREEILEEIRQLKDKMDKAEQAFSLKLAEAAREGKLQSGGYIVTGEESEDFMETLVQLREFEEECCAGVEKAAFRDARLSYLDKFAELDSIEKEILFAENAVKRAKEEKELGAENE